MRMKKSRSGVALLITIFVIALLSVAVAGILSVVSTDILIMQNYANSAEAKATANAGLNDALAQLRQDRTWEVGFTDKAFNGGTYSVNVNKGEITVVGTTEKGFSARLVSKVTISAMGPPYTVRQDSLTLNH